MPSASAFVGLLRPNLSVNRTPAGVAASARVSSAPVVAAASAGTVVSQTLNAPYVWLSTAALVSNVSRMAQHACDQFRVGVS